MIQQEFKNGDLVRNSKGPILVVQALLPLDFKSIYMRRVWTFGPLPTIPQPNRKSTEKAIGFGLKIHVPYLLASPYPSSRERHPVTEHSKLCLHLFTILQSPFCFHGRHPLNMVISLSLSLSHIFHLCFLAHDQIFINL